MARLTPRPVPTEMQTLKPLLRYCPTCGETLWAAYHNYRRITQVRGRIILALDGLQPDVGHEVLWVLRDCLSGEVLLARSLLSATHDDLAHLVQEGVPAVMEQKTSIRYHFLH